MLSEHNPIAELIYQIQKKWMDDVSPHPDVKLARWLIKPEEARLYQGFLKLESTEHGALPEVVVAMLTPFVHEDTYAEALVRDWNQACEDDTKTQEKLAAKEKSNQWEPALFSADISDTDPNTYLLNMLASFCKEVVGAERRLVVALLPHSIQNIDGYKHWLNTLLKLNIPDSITFMIFDHVGSNYYDGVLKKFPEQTKSLHVHLNLDGAVAKIARMGNPNAPEVQFRQCILEMGQALQKGSEKQLHQWGEKGLHVTQRSGSKGLYASAHIVYAGMLFNFKRFDKIDALLANGLKLATHGLKTADPSCKPLLIQFHGYIAASKQLQKRIPPAIDAFEKQGDLATQYGLPGMALTPYQQAYTLSQKHLPQRYEGLLQKAFAAGQLLQPEEQTHSAFAAIAYDFMKWQESRQRWDEAERIDGDLKKLFGADWQAQAKKPAQPSIKHFQTPMPVN